MMVEWSREQLLSYSIICIFFEDMIPISNLREQRKECKKRGNPVSDPGPLPLKGYDYLGSEDPLTDLGGAVYARLFSLVGFQEAEGLVPHGVDAEASVMMRVSPTLSSPVSPRPISCPRKSVRSF